MINSLSGLTIAIVVVMALVILALVIAVIKPAFANKAGKFVQAAEADMRRGLSDVEPLMQRAEAAVETELDKLLLSAETRLMDLSGVQTKRAHAAQLMSDASKAEMMHRAMLDAHIEKLQQFRAGLPTNGS